MPNRMVELHDSTVTAIAVKSGGEAVISFAHAYVHSSEGDPGLDSGRGWSQAAELKFVEATVTGRLLELPQDVWHGHLKLGDKVLQNMIPAPLNYDGPAELELVFTAVSGVVIAGRSVSLTLIGDPQFIEDFPGL